MQVPILNGIYTDNGPDVRVSYPVNMIPVAEQNGVSAGYLRPADGITTFATGLGVDRGAINWNGICYRVSGSKLISVTEFGVVTELGDVGGVDSLVTMDYGFDRLAIASEGKLFYYFEDTLTEVTDPDLLFVLDVVWVDGYFLVTNGDTISSTELSDPTSVLPTKYVSAEADPDPVKGLVKIRNEVYATNRYTTEVFDNVGGSGFPFQRIEGAQIQKGAIGTHTAAVFAEQLAFLGGGRNESPAVYLGANGNAQKISTHEIELLLQDYTELQLQYAKLESRSEGVFQHLYIHLPDRTLVFSADATSALQKPVWSILTTATVGFGQYLARNLVWAYDKYIVGSPTSSAIGAYDNKVSSHYGEVNRWEFGTQIVYNEAKGAIFHDLELISLTGRIAVGTSPRINTSYSADGEQWSQDKYIEAGTTGDRKKRLAWIRQGKMDNFRMQRFRGTSDAHLSFLRLEATLEALAH